MMLHQADRLVHDARDRNQPELPHLALGKQEQVLDDVAAALDLVDDQVQVLQGRSASPGVASTFFSLFAISLA